MSWQLFFCGTVFTEWEAELCYELKYPFQVTSQETQELGPRSSTLSQEAYYSFSLHDRGSNMHIFLYWYGCVYKVQTEYLYYFIISLYSR